MADYGLLGGVAEGLKSALGSYQDEKKRQDELGLKKKMFAAELAGKGLAETSDGGFDYTSDYKKDKGLDRLSKTSGLLKEGYKPSYSETTGEWTTEETPDVELNRNKTRAEIAKLMADADKAGKETSSDAPGKRPNADMYKAAGFGLRLSQSEDIFDKLQASGYDPTSKKNWIQRTFVPDALGGLKDAELQAQEQAERNFVNATLRRESGAAISPSEFENARKQYLPQPGDGPDVLAQKKANRMAVRATFDAEGGKANESIQTSLNRITGGQDDSGGLLKTKEIPVGKTQRNPKTGQVRTWNGKSWEIK